MIQNQTEILIKDNSGLLKGRVIQTKGRARVGDLVKIAVTRVKRVQTLKRKTKIDLGKSLQDVLVIQTKKPLGRYDGSSVTLPTNGGVAVILGRKRRLQLGFKRINTCVPLEVRKINQGQTFRGSYNLIKLGKTLL